jgi:putative phosphoesterase
MLLAVISDTHLPRGARRLPDACVTVLASSDLIVHAGDLSESSVLRELSSLGPPVAAVHGNVDTPELRRLLPAERVVEAEGVRIGVIHDAGPARGRIARLRRRFPECAAVIFGHSHIPLHERDADGFQIFNPGSPTDRRRQPVATMGLARVESGVTFELVELEAAPAARRPAG